MTPGTRLGPYEIVEAIGAGGMGAVYRARDSRLGRDVAIKVSAADFGDRFEREARAIAALNHPHICTLHDVGPNYLVMELVEGPTLADRIRQGPIALDESLRIARQIADALQAAHERGIVHRDLKPANVKITPDGAVKVLDFGLAKHADSSALAANPDESPTMQPPTEVGGILGTAAYMSPEQARGHAVDRRADIWAFGVVLYEMITGRRPFVGGTASDTMASVLTIEPSWDAVPPAVQPLLRRCLVKDPKRRLRDIGDIDLLLDGAPAAAPARRSWIAWSVAALLLIALGPIAVRHLREQPEARESIRFQIPTTVTLAASGNLALSPDGRYLGFLGVGVDGRVRIWIRTMDSLEVRPLEGSETAVYAPPFFWSPDSRFIAFDAGGSLKKLNIAGGPAQTLCDLPAPAIGGSWNRHGDIIVGNVNGGLLRVSEAGGPASPLTALDSAGTLAGHLLPTFLPDGRHFVYLRVSRATSDPGGGTYVGSLDAKPDEQRTERLMPYATGLGYAPSTTGGPGRLLFVREGTLMAQPFDDQRLALAGDAVPVAERVGVYLDGAPFSASFNNILVYRAADPESPLTWFDRQGAVTGRVSEPGRYASVALSPDGTHAVASRTSPRDRANADLWLLDLVRGGSPTRFTFLTGLKADDPVWSPDGKRIAFFRFGASAQVGLYQKLLGSAQDEDMLQPATRGLMTPTSWSPDGRFLLYAETASATGWDLWVMSMDGGLPRAGAKPIPFVRTRFDEQQGRFSPDGRWVAYVSNESGTNDIYVRAFKADVGGGSASVGASVLVSRGGGSAPRWRRDGKELFYLAPTGTMMSVEVTTGAAFQAGTPAPLFQTPPNVIVGDVSADGKRFLLGQNITAPFTVVLNWMRD